jgi:rhodanese-related sulfurtransferase
MVSRCPIKAFDHLKPLLKGGDPMKKRGLILCVISLLLLTPYSNGFCKTAVPEKKQTSLGLYMTALEAFSKWHVKPDRVKILDVRTPAEYVFVGHAPMAVNIPILLFKNEFDTQKNEPLMTLNENFVAEVRKKFKETDTILVMCRSGGRSAKAVNLLAEAGFKNVYNIVDGFEGDELDIEGSYYKGKRVVNGWKNSGAPWTYLLDSELLYLP